MREWGMARHWISIAAVVAACSVSSTAWARDPIVVGVHDAAPIASWNADGKPEGFAIDVLESIARGRGWELEYVEGNWDQQLRAVAAGDIDLLVPVDPNQRRDSGVEIGQEAVITSWGQVFAPKGASYDNVTELENARIAVVADDAFGRELALRLERFDIEHRVHEFDDLAGAFGGVARGSADVVAVERLAGGLAAPEFELGKTPIIFHPTAATFAAPADGGTEILSALDADLALQKRDPNSDYAMAMDRWFAPAGESRIPQWISWLLGALGGGLVLSLGVVRLYRRQVRRATAKLREQNEQLQHEIIERERAEDQLRHAQKMEALGHLAAGLAHDFNNLLTVIYGYADRMVDTDDEFALEASEAIRNATAKAGKITRQLLAMASKQTLQLEIVEPNAMLEDLQGLLASALRDDIRLTIDLDGDAPKVEIDKAQMQQVLLSLAVNAEEAMPEGGLLTLSTRVVDIGPERGLANTGPHLEIRVEDTGHGMDAQTQAHVFDPFYTTKGERDGSGLGLAVAYGLVRQSGGDITVASEPGRGTRFSIVLPATSEAANAQTAPTRLPSKASVSRVQAHGAVLFVDDNDALRRAMCRVLRRSEFEVIEAASGAEALALADRRQDIRLIVTDVVMPEMRGPELVRKLDECGVHAPVLYISGYSADDMPVVENGAEFLPKPFSPGELVARIGKMLATRRQSERAPTRAAPERLHPADSTPLARIQPRDVRRSG